MEPATGGAQQDELVILVHGTFAGDKDRSDIGHRWWQCGSETWNWLRTNLPAGTCVPEGHLVFHWSGANTWTARLSASTDLLALMMSLERQGRPYHLVGHSHGGSIIWEALLTCHAIQRSKSLPPHLEEALNRRMLPGTPASSSSLLRDLGGAVSNTIADFLFRWWWRPLFHYGRLRRQFDSELELKGLRSWTTVGTPFLWHLPRGGRLVKGWRHPSYTLQGEVGSVRSLGRFWPVISFTAIILIGVLVGMALDQPAFGRWTVPRSAALAALVLGVAISAFAYPTTANAAAAYSLTTRAKLARPAFARYGERWLGLCAPTDEAVDGLKALCPTDAPPYEQLWAPATQRQARSAAAVVPPIPVLLRLNARVKRVSLVPELDLTPFLTTRGLPHDIANRWIMPPLNKLLAARLIRTAQGCDVAHADLVYVSTCPLPINVGVQLPDHLAQALEEAALLHARELGPGVRQLVARAAINGATSPEVFVGARPSWASKALVHTSYFDMPDVLRLICAHIAASSRTAAPVPGLPERDLQVWIRQTHERVARNIRELEPDDRALENIAERHL